MTEAENINSTEIGALVEITREFLRLADEFLSSGDISKEEYERITLLKKKFLEDIDAK